MRLPQDYDAEILIPPLTALGWSKDPSVSAVKMIQRTVREHFAEFLSPEEATWILGSLLNRRLLRMQIHPDEVNKRGLIRKHRGRRGKYVQIPPEERLTINSKRS